jgi:hypothetical protein
MIKFTQSECKITPFGGFNFCRSTLANKGIFSLINQQLGPRCRGKGFSYGQVLESHMAVFLCGGGATEDVGTHLHDDLKQMRGMEPCGADTILRTIRGLATDSEQEVSKNGISHWFNINRPLNKLAVTLLRETGQLSTQGSYDLDYDNEVIETEKYDAQRTYKGGRGYQPGVASIGNRIVYIEGRGGNSQATYQQGATLKRAFEVLDDQQISINRFRADVASYQKGVVEVAAAKAETFYIRARRSGAMARRINELPEEAWRTVRLKAQRMQVAELPDWQPFGEDTPYRLVISRIKREQAQEELFEQDTYTWRAILTNDTETTPKEVVAFYNQRGAAERLFDEMGNDFGWKKLPCSFLNENTAFMILSAIYHNLYRFLIATFAEKLEWLQPTFRLKKFIFRFITVPAKWIKSGRQHLLRLYTSKDYTPLRC